MLKKFIFEKLIYAKWIRKIDEKIENDGVQEAARAILRKLKVNLQVLNLTEDLKWIFTREAVIVISNHPAEADILVLGAAFPKRDDFYAIVNANFFNLSKGLDKHFIPVYVNHNMIRKDKFNLRLRLFKKFHGHFNMTKEEEHLKNLESVANAAFKIKQGGLVIIFPGAGKKTGWFSGIGHLISQVGLSEVNLVFARISGTSTLDYLRVIPNVSKILSSYMVIFSKPKKAIEYLKMPPKIITNKLFEEYSKWEKELENSNF